MTLHWTKLLKQMNIVTNIEDQSNKPDLRFWYNLDSHILTFQAPFLGLSRASKPEMPTPHLFSKLIMSHKLLGVPKVLIQGNLTLVSFRNWGLIRLNRAVPPCQQCPDVLSRRRRREWALKNAQRSWTHTRIDCRWVLEETRQRTWAVEGKVGGFWGLGIWDKIVLARNWRVFGFVLWICNGFSMTESHGIRNPIW